MEVERRRLITLERPDLARKVRWVAAEDGDGAGYDVLSFAPDGAERLIEVKTTNGSARTPFFLTRNECEVADARAEAWRLYRVHLFAQTPRVFSVAPPLDKVLSLRTETWRATPLYGLAAAMLVGARPPQTASSAASRERKGGGEGK